MSQLQPAKKVHETSGEIAFIENPFFRVALEPPCKSSPRRQSKKKVCMCVRLVSAVSEEAVREQNNYNKHA